MLRYHGGLHRRREVHLSRIPDCRPTTRRRVGRPGASSNQCFVCWYILTRGLVETKPGGGGQIGHWTRLRRNSIGALVQLRMLSRQFELNSEKTGKQLGPIDRRQTPDHRTQSPVNVVSMRPAGPNRATGQDEIAIVLAIHSRVVTWPDSTGRFWESRIGSEKKPLEFMRC